jgi:hypothetical protein
MKAGSATKRSDRILHVGSSGHSGIQCLLTISDVIASVLFLLVTRLIANTLAEITKMSYDESLFLNDSKLSEPTKNEIIYPTEEQ